MADQLDPRLVEHVARAIRCYCNGDAEWRARQIITAILAMREWEGQQSTDLGGRCQAPD